MPQYTVGGIDLTAEPDFSGFPRKLREGIREQEAKAPSVRIPAEPQLSSGFRRELARIVREAAVGVSTEIEATPSIRRGFRTELVRLVREAALDVTVPITAEVNLPSGFRKELTTKVREAALGVSIEVPVTPIVGAGFKRELRNQVQIAQEGIAIKVEVSASIARGFRARLRELIDKSSAGVGVKVEVSPTLSKNFRKDLKLLVDRASAKVRGQIVFDPKLDSKFRSKLRAMAKEKTGEFPVNLVIKTERPRDIRTKLLEAIRLATENPPLVAKVFIEPQVADLRRKTQAAIRKVSAEARIAPSADTSTFSRQVRERVARVTAEAKSIAKIPVSLATAGFSKGLTIVRSGLQTIRRLVTLTATGFGLLGVAVAAVGATGLKSSADLEQEQLALQNLLGSVAEGNKLFAGLAQQAKATPFEIPDLSPLLRQFVVIRNTLHDENAFGIKDLLPAVQTVTDLGAVLKVTGPQIQRVGLALSKVAGRGKLTSEELRSINKNLPGFSAIQAVAEQLGITVPEAFEKISAGEVDSATAIQAILAGMKAFPGAAGFAAKAAEQTFKGALSNFPDIVRITFYEAFASQLPRLTQLIGPNGPLIGAAKKGVEAIAGPFTDLAVTIGNLLNSSAGTIATAFSVIVPILQTIAGLIVPLLPAVQTFISFIGQALAPLAPALGALSLFVGRGLTAAFFVAIGPAKQFFTIVGDILVALGPAIQVVLKLVPQLAFFLAQLATGLLPIVTQIAPALTPLVAVLQDVIFAVGTIAAQAGPALADVLTGLLGGILNIGHALLPILPVIAGAIGGVLDALAPALPVLGQVIGLLATVIANFAASALPALAQGLAALVVAAEPIAEALVPVGAALGDVFTAVIGALIPLLPPLGQFIASLGPPLVKILETLVPVVEAMGKAWAKAVPIVLDTLLQIGAPLLKGLLSFFVQLVKATLPLAPIFLDLFKSLGPVLVLMANALGAQSGRLGEVFAALVTSGIELVKAIAPLLPALVKGLIPILKVLASIAPKVTPSLVKLAKAFGDQLAPLLGDLVTSLVPLIVKQGPLLAEVFTEFLVALIPLLPPLTELTIALLPIIVEFLPVITTILRVLTPLLMAWADAMSLVAGHAARLIGWIVKLVGWVASFAAAALRVGHSIVDGLLKGLGGALAAVNRFLGRIFHGIIDFVKGILGIHSPSSVFKDIALDVIAGFIHGLGGMAASVLTKLGHVGLTILGWMLDLPGKLVTGIDAIAGMGKDIGSGIIGGIKDAVLGVAKLGGDLASAVWGPIARFINSHLIDKVKGVSFFGKHPFGFLPTLPEKLAVGGLFKSPTLALIAEAGPELVLPLNDKQRILELLRQAGLLDVAQAALAGLAAPAGAAAKSGGPGVGLSFAPDPKLGADFTRKSGEAIADLGTQLAVATTPGLDRWRKGVGDQLNEVVGSLADFGQRARQSMSGTVGALTSIAATGSNEVVGALRTGLGTGSATVGTIVRSYARSLAGALNPVLDAIGQPKINLGQFARGGLNDPRIVPDGSYNVHVFGERGTRGEAYIPFDPKLRSSSRAIADETVRRLGGQATWFRQGGVTGDLAGLNPEFLRRLDRWSYAVGGPYNVDSGYRSLDEQKRLYQRWLAGVPGQAPAAVPGHSMHNFGLASDGNRWSGRKPGAFGLRYPMGYEPWHVEPNEARQWAASRPDVVSIMPLPRVPGAGPYGALSLTAKKAMQFTYGQGLAWAGKQALASPGGTLQFSGGSGNEAAAAAAILQAIALTGVPTSWYPGLLTIARRESGFDARAVNLWDSNARAGHPSEGLMQMILSTFLAHALPGMTDIFNPVHNAASAIRYILAAYGSIENVQQADPSAPPRGYGDGAIVNREHMARVAELNKPEVIIPLTKPQRALALADQSGVSDLVRDRDGRYVVGPRNVFEEGSIVLKVEAPAGRDPSIYASSLHHRIIPILSAALDRVDF